jgi:tetratricopeptide (TPR) repeat protein
LKTPASPALQKDPSGRRWQTPGICLALALLIAAIYAPVRHFEFLNYDDDVYVTVNPTVQAGLTSEGFRWAMTANQIGHWHPLTWLSHMLDCEYFGMNAGGPHVINVLLHAATAILLFLVLRKMTGAIWPSALAAALFAIHPQRVESVAWISERKDVLSGVFFMLTLMAYARWVNPKYEIRNPSSEAPRSAPGFGLRASFGSRISGFAFALLFFALGLLSKGMLVTLPFVLLLLDYWPLQRFDSAGENRIAVFARLVIEKIPFFLLAVASCIITSRAPEIISQAGRWTPAFRFENAAISYVDYLWQMIVPVRLAVPYLVPDQSPPWWEIAGAISLLVAITWLVIALRKRHPYLIVGWFWYLGMSVPVIGLVQISYYARADRYTYLPLIGPAIAIAWLAKDLAARRPQLRFAMVVAACLAIGLLSLRTADQLQSWRNNFTLWQHTLDCFPGNAYAHNNLGIALAEKGRTGEAIQHYQAALESKPDFIQAHNNLGNALLEKKKVNEAIVHFRQALQLEPDLAQTHNNLGNALRVDGKIDDAVAEYQRAIQLKPDFALAWDNLGSLQLARNEIAEAVAACREALRLQPGAPARELNLGRALLKQGNADEAALHLRKGLAPGPDEADAHFEMGKALSKPSRFAEAITEYETALKLQPANPEAHNNLGNLLATTGHADAAAEHYEEALRLQPGNVEAHNNYAGLLLQKNRIGDAIIHYEEALRLNPKFVPAMRNLVWIRAACVDARFRDGAKALELAQRAAGITDGRDAATLDALAAAQAENGRFTDAIATAAKARELAAGQPALAAGLERRLALYRRNLPYRMGN